MAAKTDAAYSIREPGEGPFRASQIRDGDPYELSNGHPIKCMGASERHGKANMHGGLALATDPKVHGAIGVDTGIEFNDGKNLRAPDLVLGIEGKAGWSKKIPPLCVEYADRGQNEQQLREKIDELLAAGTRYIWVVRLSGPLRVEVYEPKKKMRLVNADGVLSAPGILQNTYSPRELVDQEEALRVSFRNQLQVLGYESLDEVRDEARQEALAERDQALAARDQALEGRDQALEGRDQALEGRDQALQGRDQALQGRDQALQEQSQALSALRSAIFDLCELLGIQVSEARKRRVQQMDAAALDALRQAIKTGRRWPKG